MKDTIPTGQKKQVASLQSGIEYKKIFEMFLFFIVLFLSVLRGFGSNLAHIISNTLGKLLFRSQKIKSDTKSNEIKTLELELANINMQDEFSKYSKMQRKINKMSTEMNKDMSEQTTFTCDLKRRLSWSFYGVTSILLLFIMIVYKNSPVCYFPENNFTMFNSFIAFPFCEIGQMSCFIWSLCCNTFVVKLAETYNLIYTKSAKLE